MDTAAPVACAQAAPDGEPPVPNDCAKLTPSFNAALAFAQKLTVTVLPANRRISSIGWAIYRRSEAPAVPVKALVRQDVAVSSPMPARLASVKGERETEVALPATKICQRS